jgi:hypothetical protein
MEKKPPTSQPIEKTNKSPLYSGKEPKKNGSSDNN